MPQYLTLAENVIESIKKEGEGECDRKIFFTLIGEFKHEVRQFQKPYDNQQAEQISLMV